MKETRIVTRGIQGVATKSSHSPGHCQQRQPGEGPAAHESTKTNHSADGKSAVIFTDTVEVVNRNGSSQLSFDDKDGEVANTVSSGRERVSFLPLGNHEPETRNATPWIPRKYEDYMDDLPEAVIF
ncbi:hypothetical protein ElyMa_001776600 [Elysia marginata]|uniref:Uncharacterized protein n=1 Tax=Elysia marginata TaxID=1093978 RepID=A0AAV4ED78_9GAST|nr:hypothetical protein ElyMa_001776600 [Elysia marginata]